MEEQAARLVDHRSAQAWGPIVVNRPAHPERRLLRLVAFNARGGRLLTDIAERLRHPPLAEPDIILLSEADWRLKRSGRREVAAELAAELSMSFAYVGEFGVVSAAGPPVAFTGNAILSSRPLTEVKAVPLGRTFISRRLRRRAVGAAAGLVARIIVNRRPLTVGIAHLNSRGNPAGRELQIKHYLQGLPRDGPAIIGGDFNTTTVDLRSASAFVRVLTLMLLNPRRFRHPQSWEPLFDRLDEAGFRTSEANVRRQPTFTFSRFIPPSIRPKLDWLALRGLEVTAGSAAVVAARRSVLSGRFSDHDFVTCTVRV